jgi:Kazal-type serine protease inhibitor domain
MRKIALIPAIAAAFAIASCQPKATEPSGNDVNASVSNVALETEAADNGAVAGNSAATNATATSNAAATNDMATSNSAAPQSYGSGSPTGGTCGGIVGRQCASHKDFCKLPDGQCKVSDAQGTCTRRPEICPKIFKPVCGCDHKTYGNACEASAAGVSVQSQGACPKG